jgi:hypothetical protein
MAARGLFPKKDRTIACLNLRWLCEVAHTWGRNTCGTLPNPGSHGRWGPCPTHTTCDFCKRGHVTGRNEGISFRQWTDKGYVFCRAEIPLGVCDCYGARNWNQDAEAIINEVVRREYDKLRLTLL